MITHPQKHANHRPGCYARRPLTLLNTTCHSASGIAQNNTYGTDQYGDGIPADANEIAADE
jgi:hypothetical protein